MTFTRRISGLTLLALAVWIGLLIVLPTRRTTYAAPWPPRLPIPPDAVVGTVRNATGPIPGATVRVKATNHVTITTADGLFMLSGLSVGSRITITAWADGYFVGWVDTVPGIAPVTIILNPYYQTDNPDYTWFSTEGSEGSESCAHCMPACEEWALDAHSQSAVNPRFLSLYNGTDVYGNQSPPTRRVYRQDYGYIPLSPDLTQPYYGPGYKLDFPRSAGNCSTCHIPEAAAQPGAAYAADPNLVEGIALEGVFCEFCHKIGEVMLDPATDLPYPNRPGTLSMRLFRPEEGHQLFFGNFDDVTRRVSYLPLEEESAFCAPCHYGVFWDTVIYNSYGEWLDSPYSDPDTGQTCQDCHMPLAGYDYFVFPEQGGLHRDPDRIFSHQMPGAQDVELLQNAVTMTVDARRTADQIAVHVDITNDRTGHHVPTDSPLRHLILLVEAADSTSQPLTQIDGPTVPVWGGVGDPAHGYYAGLPGTAYAKILRDLWTEIEPSGAYWNPTLVVSDNRIAALATDTTRYTFASPDADAVTVRVRLIFRRAFIELMDQKGWNMPDIVMADQQVTLGDAP